MERRGGLGCGSQGPTVVRVAEHGFGLEAPDDGAVFRGSARTGQDHGMAGAHGAHIGRERRQPVADLDRHQLAAVAQRRRLRLCKIQQRRIADRCAGLIDDRYSIAEAVQISE